MYGVVYFVNGARIVSIYPVFFWKLLNFFFFFYLWLRVCPWDLVCYNCFWLDGLFWLLQDGVIVNRKLVLERLCWFSLCSWARFWSDSICGRRQCRRSSTLELKTSTQKIYFISLFLVALASSRVYCRELLVMDRHKSYGSRRKHIVFFFPISLGLF